MYIMQHTAIKNVIPKNDVTNNNIPVKLDIELIASLLVSIDLSTLFFAFSNAKASFFMFQIESKLRDDMLCLCILSYFLIVFVI